MDVNPAYRFLKENLALINDLHFVSTFHRAHNSRCPHKHSTGQVPVPGQYETIYEFPETRVAKGGVDGLTRLQERLRPLLERLGENSLRSLRYALPGPSSSLPLLIRRNVSWDVGTCVPDIIINSPWILQDKIQNLSLIIDSTCKTPIALGGLQRLKHLRKFSWQGVPPNDGFVHLKNCLHNNAKHLRSLRINLVSWQKVSDVWLQATLAQELDGSSGDAIRLCHGVLKMNGHSSSYKQSSNFFARSTLNLQCGVSRSLFTHLTRLSLSCVSFQSMVVELACALNISNLRHLSLWKCPATLDLLAELVKSQKAIRLTLLELVISWDREEEPRISHESSEVGNFLGTFQGLIDLYLMLPSEDEYPFQWDSVIQGMQGHFNTIERLVCHSRLPIGDAAWDEDTFGSITEPGFVIKCPKLQCLGLSYAYAVCAVPTLLHPRLRNYPAHFFIDRSVSRNELKSVVSNSPPQGFERHQQAFICYHRVSQR